MKAIYTTAAMIAATQAAAQTPETSTWLCDNQMGAVITLTAQTVTSTGTITCADCQSSRHAFGEAA